MYYSITRCSNQDPEVRLPDVCYSKLVYDRWILVLEHLARRDFVLIPVRLWLLLELAPQSELMIIIDRLQHRKHLSGVT